MRTHGIVMDSVVDNVKCGQMYLTKRYLVSLTRSAKYHILDLQFVSTQFGHCVVVDLEKAGGVCPQTVKIFVFIYRLFILSTSEDAFSLSTETVD